MEDFTTQSAMVLNDLARLIQRVCGVSSALILATGIEGQWGASEDAGLTPEEFCDATFYSHSINRSKPFVVNDAFADPRFADSPLIASRGSVRFYAAIPLRATDSYPLGILCVMDQVPRQMNDEQMETLLAFARQATILLEAHQRVNDLEQLVFSRSELSDVELRASEERFFKAFDASPEPMTITKFVDGVYLYVNKSFVLKSGYSQSEIIGRSTLELNIWAKHLGTKHLGEFGRQRSPYSSARGAG